MNRKFDSVRIAFSRVSVRREIQKDLQSQFRMAEFQKPIFDVGYDVNSSFKGLETIGPKETALQWASDLGAEVN